MYFALIAQLASLSSTEVESENESKYTLMSIQNDFEDEEFFNRDLSFKSNTIDRKSLMKKATEWKKSATLKDSGLIAMIAKYEVLGIYEPLDTKYTNTE